MLVILLNVLLTLAQWHRSVMQHSVSEPNRSQIQGLPSQQSRFKAKKGLGLIAEGTARARPVQGPAVRPQYGKG